MAPFGAGIGPWMLAAIVALVLVLFGFETVWSVRQALRQPAPTPEALRKHDRAAGSVGRAAAIIGYLVCGLTIALTAASGGDDSGASLWVGGAVGFVALMLVERRWPAPGGTVRSADLRARRLTDIFPSAGGWIAGTAVLLAVGSIVVCGVLGDGGESGTLTAADGWPTWSQSAGALIGLAAMLGLAAVSVIGLLRRPALAGFDSQADLAYRRSGVDRSLRLLSFLGYVEVSNVLNSMKNAAFQAGVPYGSIRVIVWASLATVFAALASIYAFRARPPRAAASHGPSTFLAATR